MAATLIAPENADPIADAELLRKACQGWGTDEKGLISVIGHRNAAQRRMIEEAYESQYNENLIRRLEKSSMETLRELCVGGCWNPSIGRQFLPMLLSRNQTTK